MSDALCTLFTETLGKINIKNFIFIFLISFIIHSSMFEDLMLCDSVNDNCKNNNDKYTTLLKTVILVIIYAVIDIMIQIDIL